MFSSLYLIIISPIEIIIETAYVFFLVLARGNYGFAIIGVSLFVSFLCFPLYAQAEGLQKKERAIQKRMEKRVKSIKKHFKGDEQYMILSMYYRENHYHPFFALRSSMSLLIQIPFFIAAYSFLSHLEVLKGVSLFVIPDLGKPDGLLSFGPYTFNALPLVMTLINIAAGAVYTRGFPLRERVQLYGMALVFLVLLYGSPSALVLYWTFNNVFSLGKNIIYASPYPAKILKACYLVCCAALLLVCLYVIFIRPNSMFVTKIITIAASVFLAGLPFIVKTLRRVLSRIQAYQFYEAVCDITPPPHIAACRKDLNLLFFLSCAAAWVLCGIVIPFNVAASDPAEFSFLVENPSPFAVLLPSVFLAFGLCVFWPVYMYFLASRRIKCIFSFAASFFVIAAVVNTFVFSGDYGVLSRILAFAPGINLRGSFLFWGLNAVVMVFLFCAAAFLWGIRRIRWLTSLMAILLIAGTGVSVWKAAKIQEGFISYRDAVLAGKKGGSSFDGQSLNEEVRPVITLSETGKNVVVLMLDRAISSYLPLIFEERPELKSAFEGFTYYPNTVSYAPGTILGAPPIFGGYDYTPQKLQARKDAVMAEKHNEAILFLPALLRDKGYTASVFDLPYGNYQFIQDISFFTSRGIFADNILGRYDRLFLEETNRDTSLEVKVDAVLRRNFIMFSFFSASPVVLRPAIYRRGSYWNAVENDHQDLVPVIDSYAALYYLPKLTQTVKEGNSLVLMANYLTHSPGLLQYPDYTIPPKITDTGPLRFNEDMFALRHYHVNAAAYLLLSKWFSRLREMGVYDNTRIIIAADHGQGGIALPRVPDDVKNFVGPHNPVLLVKDFDAKGALKTVTDFMTNADAALCALQGIVPDAVNPFTGNAAVPDKENGATLVINAPFNAEDYEGYAALKSSSQLVHVKDNIFDIKNWGSVFTWKE